VNLDRNSQLLVGSKPTEGSYHRGFGLAEVFGSRTRRAVQYVGDSLDTALAGDGVVAGVDGGCVDYLLGESE